MSTVRTNVSVGIRYIKSWLRGAGAAAIDNLMEDAVTAEISKSQLWQWVHADTTTVEGELITEHWYRPSSIVTNVMDQWDRFAGDRFDDAVQLFTQVALGEEFVPFLTTSGHELLV